MIVHKDIDAYPKFTPIFGKCSACGCALPYPPVQVPTAIKPKDKKFRWEIHWIRLCFDCAPATITTKAKDTVSLVPDKAWDPEREGPIDNPFKQEITNESD